MYFYSGLIFLIAIFGMFLLFSSSSNELKDENMVKEEIFKANDARNEQNQELKIKYKEYIEEQPKVENIVKKDEKIEDSKEIDELKALENEVSNYVNISSVERDDITIEIISSQELVHNESMFPQIPTLVTLDIDGESTSLAIPTELIQQNGDIALRVIDNSGKVTKIQRLDFSNNKDESLNIPQIPSL